VMNEDRLSKQGLNSITKKVGRETSINAGSTLEHTDSDGEEELNYRQGGENSLSFSEQQKC